MKKIVTHPFALIEIMSLIEHGYHCAYTEDCGDYYTVLVTNDNGQMEEKDISDRYFDFDYIEVED